jgi:hypothetical protein
MRDCAGCGVNGADSSKKIGGKKIGQERMVCYFFATDFFAKP